MSICLLDVNLLIALAWPSHVHHRPAHRWFAEQASSGWATCPITQCGFVRISANPLIIPDAVSPGEATTVLREMTNLRRHHFWPDDVDLADKKSASDLLLLGHRQVTDGYLVQLAIRHRARLATLDRNVGALLGDVALRKRHLEIVPAT